MSLIRSEHVNDQAVQAAKDRVAEAERTLEEARSRLEKRERAQYHEEQIWSDTIRRNSTWVTFGLMGVNILLLLANVVVIEPWRRRRMVREIKKSLDENTAAAAAIALAQPVAAAPAPSPPLAVMEITQPVAVEEEIDNIIEPVVPLEQLESVAAAISAAEREVEEKQVVPEEISPAEGQQWSKEGLKAQVQYLFSEQKISMRRVDVTMIAIEAASAGAALVGIFVALLRPR
jgi:sensitive to high expression protein 9, mitochondrial